jgi:hypothetical protein
MGDLKKLLDTICLIEDRPKYHQDVLRAFEAYARDHYMNARPRIEFLPVLSQFNLARAMFANVEVMGLSPSQMHDDALSPFNTAGPLMVAMDARQASLPQALRPTSLQIAIPHHPWIDLIPVPVLRDNILVALTQSLDEESFCQTLSGRTRTEQPGVRVWRDPWDPSGWEVTEVFVQSYGWLLKDCWTLLESTNRWRTGRGERPLYSQQANEPARRTPGAET